MAEGLAQVLLGDRVPVMSAGSESTTVTPFALDEVRRRLERLVAELPSS